MNSFAYESPVGWLNYVLDTDGALLELLFSDEPAGGLEATNVAKALDRYFAGDSAAFDLPVRPKGTEFQRQVWAQLQRIPFAETRSYGQIAEALGNPGSVRAVGAANGANPIAIVIPCHRVIGANGSLTGFGGGLERKAWLLEHESKQRRLF